MPADVIQSRYDQLDAIAGSFGSQAEYNAELQRRVARAMQLLEQGGWEGRGAAAFFGEMRGELQPATQRLVRALQEAQGVTLQIKTIMQQAEQEAANPFKGEDAGVVSGSIPVSGSNAGTQNTGAGSVGSAAPPTPPSSGNTPAPATPGSNPKDRLQAALGGSSVDKAAITQALATASDTQKAEILGDRALMARLRAGLNESEFRAAAKQLVDVANVPKGAIQTQAAELLVSAREIDNNTALNFVKGTVHPYYIQDLRQPANVDQLVSNRGYDPAKFTIYLVPPANTRHMLVQKDFLAFADNGSSSIFVSNTAPDAEMRRNLVHETNHVRNAPFRGAVATYESEFRAYWVDGGPFNQISDPAQRAAAIRQHVLNGYPAIKQAYDSDPAVKRSIDAHTTPTGNLTNS